VYTYNELCFRFGHQDIITAIDALSLGRAVTSGAKDGSIRIWKIAEESQLVFHGHRLYINFILHGNSSVCRLRFTCYVNPLAFTAYYLIPVTYAASKACPHFANTV